MGDILNAGALGLYGVVIGKESVMPKILRINEYLRLLAQLEKLPPLFRNVAVFSAQEFDALIAAARRCAPDRRGRGHRRSDV
jgi:hypothetical protein